MDSEILIFECDQSLFGVPADSVCEVVRAVAVTPVPHTQPAVMGKIDLRGKLIPVFSARSLLQMTDRPLHPNDQFVIMLSDDQQFALCVDRATDLAGLPDRINLAMEESQQASQLVEFTVQTEHGIVAVLSPTWMLLQLAPTTE